MNPVEHKRARQLPVWQLFSINLLIVAAVAVIAGTRYYGLAEPFPTGTPDSTPTPISTVVVSNNAASRSTPTAAETPTASASATVAPASRAVASTGEPTATLTATTTSRTAHATATALVFATPREVSPTALASRTPTPSTSWPITRSLGSSTLGWPIEAYQFGAGSTHLAFVGGIHGGYEWNTILLAYEAIDHYSKHPEQIPESITLHILPSANPDGQVRVLKHPGRFTTAEVPTDTVVGRLNGNEVDLNRNWDHDWAPIGTWRYQKVSGGEAPFSEVETQILSEWFLAMDAVILWHSARPGVYAGSCDGVYPPSQRLAAVYADAAQYPLYETFEDYAVTGSAVGWLACGGVPAIAVELTNHVDTDGEQNLAAMDAVIDAFSEPTTP